MSSVPPIQDMPPEGGYSKINFKRVPAKQMFKGITVIGIFVAVHLVAREIKFKIAMPERRRWELEMRSARLATYPFLEAEKDRACLLQLRRNRDVEEELMKDVEGWEVGTWMGEPIYKTLPDGDWWTPKFYEYFAHSKPEDYKQHINCFLRR